MTMRQGFSLVEVLLSVALFALVAATLFGSLFYSEEILIANGARGRAVLIAAEGLEAARSMRDDDFDILALGTHGLVASTVWGLSGTSETVDVFERRVEVTSPDSRRKDVNVTVTWAETPLRQGEIAATSRLTRWREPIGTWEWPYIDGSLDLSGANGARKIAFGGNFVYVVRADGPADLVIVDVSDPAAPVARGTLNVPGTPTDIALNGTTAYISSTSDSGELQIVNVADPDAPVISGSLNLAGTADANAVANSGSTVYLVRESSSDPEFVRVNASVPALPIQSGTLQLSGSGKDVVVSGSSFFVATTDDAAELQVVQSVIIVGLSLVGTEDLPGTSDATALAVSGTLALVGRADGSLETVDVSNAASPSALGTLDTGASVNDVVFAGGSGRAHLSTSAAGKEFQIADVSSPASPTLFATNDLEGSASLLGLAHDASSDRTYAVGTATDRELLIFAP